MNDQFTIEDLKDVKLNGYLIFTDATETGEDRGTHIAITNETKPGVDIALMNAGFEFTDKISNSPGMFWMKRKNENLRYHPMGNKDFEMFDITKNALARGLKTRIDFFCYEKGDAAYDVINELLKLGYKILTFSPHNTIIEKLFLIEIGDDQKQIIKEVTID